MKEKRKVDKEDFINFLASATPEEINQLIVDQGKPPKLWEPVYFFRHPEQMKEENSNE